MAARMRNQTRYPMKTSISRVICSLTLITTALGLVSCHTVQQAGHLEAGTFQRSGEIRVSLGTSRPAYCVGETLSFTVTPSEDAYLAVWVRGANGRTHRIYPNAYDSGRVFRGGVASHFPGGGDFQFRVTGPTGNDTLIVVASTQPFTCASPPSREAWLKGISVDRRNPEKRGEARIIYRVER